MRSIMLRCRYLADQKTSAVLARICVASVSDQSSGAEPLHGIPCRSATTGSICEIMRQQGAVLSEYHYDEQHRLKEHRVHPLDHNGEVTGHFDYNTYSNLIRERHSAFQRLVRQNPQGLLQRVIEHDADKDRQPRPMVVQEGFKASLGVAVAGVPELPHKARRSG